MVTILSVESFPPVSILSHDSIYA